jgi:peptidoglycan/xylan/chitin deacetylase (PgdA/CDA1 family)
MIKEMKRAGVSAFARAGMDSLAVRLHAGDALILVYHAIVSREKDEPFRYHHTISEFETHLDWLGAHCTPVGLADFARWKHGGFSPSKPPVLLTFDDGYRNNATLAAPLLRRKGFPAVFFITSGHIDDTRVLWPDEVFARVLAWNANSIQNPQGESHPVPETQAARQTLALRLVEACKNCSDVRRREFLAYLATGAPHCDPLLDPAVQQFMTWNDVRALVADGFDLGSHTVTHPILSNLNPERLWEELIESRTAIETQTGVACTALAYPNGRTRDITERVLAATAEAGYDFAFTVSNRWCPRNRDTLQIDRISPPGHSNVATFALHASGCRQWLTRSV